MKRYKKLFNETREPLIILTGEPGKDVSINELVSGISNHFMQPKAYSTKAYLKFVNKHNLDLSNYNSDWGRVIHDYMLELLAREDVGERNRPSEDPRYILTDILFGSHEQAALSGDVRVQRAVKQLIKKYFNGRIIFRSAKMASFTKNEAWKIFKRIGKRKFMVIAQDQELVGEVNDVGELFDLVFNPLFKNGQEEDAYEMFQNYGLI